MSDTSQRGRLVHNEQCAPFYASVAFENAPNLHAGLYGTKSGKRGGSGARCFAASPFGLPGFSSVVPSGAQAPHGPEAKAPAKRFLHDPSGAP